MAFAIIAGHIPPYHRSWMRKHPLKYWLMQVTMMLIFLSFMVPLLNMMETENVVGFWSIFALDVVVTILLNKLFEWYIHVHL